jgi:hypothetical protein
MNADNRSTRSSLAKGGHLWLYKNRWLSRTKAITRNHDFSLAVLDVLCIGEIDQRVCTGRGDHSGLYLLSAHQATLIAGWSVAWIESGLLPPASIFDFLRVLLPAWINFAF